jgi:excisionase family DNA binding protein
MSNPLQISDSLLGHEVQVGNRRGRITVPEIARRLDIGRLKVYAMLKQGILPGVRVGRGWIVTRQAYFEWERTCGMRSGAGLQAQPEVRVLT